MAYPRRLSRHVADILRLSVPGTFEHAGVAGRCLLSGLERTCVRPSSHLACRKIESIEIDMLVRLSRSKRLRAGWLIALIYLLCVLAPTLSFAWPGSRAVSPCLTEAAHLSGVVHMHTDAGIEHIRIEGHTHAHSSGHSQATSDGDQLRARFAPEKAPHSSDGQCCG